MTPLLKINGKTMKIQNKDKMAINLGIVDFNKNIEIEFFLENGKLYSIYSFIFIIL